MCSGEVLIGEDGAAVAFGYIARIISTANTLSTSVKNSHNFPEPMQKATFVWSENNKGSNDAQRRQSPISNGSHHIIQYAFVRADD